MAKQIDWKNLYTQLGKRTEGYALSVRSLFQQRIGEIIHLCEGLELQEGKPFAFNDYEEVATTVQQTLRKLYTEVYQQVRGSIVKEWNYSNDTTDRLIRGLFGKEATEDHHFAKYFQRNREAMQQFLQRQTNGLDLSQRVWRYVGQTRTDLEAALDLGLGQGLDADELSRQVRQYLNNPDDLFRRFRYKVGEDADGNPVYGRKWKKRCYDKATDSFYWVDSDPKDYHTGTGVYRSSYKNAMRLTRTETNMAYRAADCERWQQLPFVLGYEVRKSKNHPCVDICDDLAGTYPKEFKFVGWHPHCYCYIVPVLCKESELEDLTGRILRGEEEGFTPSGVVSSMPSQFTSWVAANRERIANASSLPYFIRDNYKGGNIAKGFKWEAGKASAAASGGSSAATPSAPAPKAQSASPSPAELAAQAQAKADAEATAKAQAYEEATLKEVQSLLGDYTPYVKGAPIDKATGLPDEEALKERVIKIYKGVGLYERQKVLLNKLTGVDNWEMIERSILANSGVSELESLLPNVQNLLRTGRFAGQPASVLAQVQHFAQQFDELWRNGEYWRAKNALAGIDNLYELIKAKADFGKVSMLMPKELLQSGAWFNSTTSKLVEKEFFDNFVDFVPCVVRSYGKDISYSPLERVVNLATTDGRYPSEWFKFKTVYHEYGHALDYQLDLRHNAKIKALWDKYNKALKVRGKHTYFEYGKPVTEDKMPLGEYIGKTLDRYYDRLTADDDKISKELFKRLGFLQTDSNSVITAYADTINSLSKGKWGWGHTKTYWKGEDSPVVEFIAHMFENRYVGNGYFKWHYREMFEEMIALLGECLK